MMLEKHLTQLLNWGYKSSVEVFFFLSFSFSISSPQGQEKAENIHNKQKYIVWAKESK